MKTAAKAAAGIALVLVLTLVLFHFSTRLSYEVSASVTPASNNEEWFDSFREQMTSGAFPGYVYESGVLDGASKYYFVTLTITVKNPGLFPAEWVLMTPIRHDGDIACDVSSAGPVDLSGGAEAAEALTILTTSPRSITECGLEYYVFGQLQSVTVPVEIS